MKLFEKFVKSLDETLFPLDYTCDICGIDIFDGNRICTQCLKTVTFNDKNTCPVCGRKTFRSEICLECKYKAPLYKKAVSPLVYDGGAIALIHKFKNGGGYLREYFADLVAEKLKILPPCDCIVYVPMTEKALKKRGYNQAELLAKILSERCGIPLAEGALVKVKETVQQKTLTMDERAKNLRECFKAERKELVKDKDVLLVDDVLTTGATADAVSEKLLKAGAKHVFLATVASVEYKQKRNKK